MAEYTFHTRGEGLAEALALGFYDESYFQDLLNAGPEPLLKPDQLARLRDFLADVPARSERRTKQQRADAEDLSNLIRSSTADALRPEATGILCQRIEGTAFRGRGRPRKLPCLPVHDIIPALAAALKQAVEERLRAGAPLELPRWLHVEEDPKSRSLPLSERSMHIAHRALSARGHDVPSVARL